MGDDLTVIVLGQGESRFDDALSAAVRSRAHQCISWLTDPMQGRRLLFAVPLPDSGVNSAFYQLLAFLRAHPGCLAGSVGATGSGPRYRASIPWFSNSAGGCPPCISLVSETKSIAG